MIRAGVISVNSAHQGMNWKLPSLLWAVVVELVFSEVYPRESSGYTGKVPDKNSLGFLICWAE